MKHPREFITEGEYRTLYDHFVKTHKCDTTEEQERVMKGVLMDQRLFVADIYKELRRQHGLYPIRLNKNQDIVWGEVVEREHETELDHSCCSVEKAKAFLRENMGWFEVPYTSWGDIQDEKERQDTVNR